MVADHNNSQLYPSFYNTITAAVKLGSVDVLVAGHQCEGVCLSPLSPLSLSCINNMLQQVAKKVSSVEGVTRVVHADHDHLEHPLAEISHPFLFSPFL